MTNIELTLDQLSQISGGAKADRQAQREAHKERRAQRKHDRQCPDGMFSGPDCPLGPDSETGEDNHEFDTQPCCTPWGPCHQETSVNQPKPALEQVFLRSI